MSGHGYDGDSAMPLEVKICGLTNADDAKRALELGADYLGFVCYPPSPRAVTPLQVARILDQLPGPFQAVAVCVNPSPQLVDALLRDCPLCAIQFHGDEEVGPWLDLPLPPWRAVRLEADGRIVPEPDDWPAARYVVDAAPPGVYGGAGVTADWEAAARFAAAHPCLLAGGLTPGNVAQAIRMVRPLGVDVSGGVEAVPGRKDPAALKAFITHARAAAGLLRQSDRP